MTPMTDRPVRPRVTLPGVSSRAWEHPADQGALVALRKLRGFDTLLKALSGLVSERALRLVYLGSAVRADERQFAPLHKLLAEVCEVLDAPRLPELYVMADPYLGAQTLGIDRPFIVVNSAVIDSFDEPELRFLLGHEVGHVLSGHAVYRTLLARLLRLATVLAPVPVGGLGVRAIAAAMMEWSRKSELSADRAGVLAAQDPAAAARVHMKLAGGGLLDEVDPASFLEQGAEYDAAGDARESVLKLLLIEARTHPFAVVRATELRRWIDSGSYTAILGGDYPRREDDADVGMSAAARAAASSYQESFRQTQDTLGTLVHEAAGWLGSAKLWLDERLRRGDDDW